MLKTEYGEKYLDHLIEQYKLYVEMADNVSQRRSQANAFYTSALSILLVIVSFIVDKSVFSDQFGVVLLAFALLGLLICVVWYFNIRSYRQLNTGKFKVVHEMEQQLPYPCYDREWELLGAGKTKKKYWQLTSVEQYVPALLAIPYVLLLFYAFRLLKVI